MEIVNAYDAKQFPSVFANLYCQTLSNENDWNLHTYNILAIFE